MNTPLNVIEALAKVPGFTGGSAEFEELKGGLTNRIYLVRTDRRQCVLRLSSASDNEIHPDRSCELAILESASAAGIAPEILYADFDAGILATEYLEGAVWQASDLEAKKNIEALAELLRRVHKLPRCGTRANMSGMAKKYADYLRHHPDLHAFASICVRIVGESPVHENLTCCHNDIVAANVIHSGNLKLIDWEYACDNNPLFDLASAIGFHDFDEGRQQLFLSAYAGGADTELRERLAEQVRIFDAVQWLWLATRHLASPNGEQARRLDELRIRIG